MRITHTLPNNTAVRAQAPSARFSSTAVIEASAQYKPSPPEAEEITAKALEDITAFSHNLATTLPQLTPGDTTIHHYRNKYGKMTGSYTRSVFRPLNHDWTAFEQARRETEQAISRRERTPGNRAMSRLDQDRMVRRQHVGLWALERHVSDKGSYISLMPGYTCDPKEYAIESYHPRVTIETQPWKAPKVVYQFPHPDNQWQRLPQVEILDPALKKRLQGMSQRLLDKLDGINPLSRLHRLAKYGYWSP